MRGELAPVEAIPAPVPASRSDRDGHPLDTTDMAPGQWTSNRCDMLAARTQRQMSVATSTVSGLGVASCTAEVGESGLADERRGVVRDDKVRDDERCADTPRKTRRQGEDDQQGGRGNPPTRGHVDGRGMMDGVSEEMNDGATCGMSVCALPSCAADSMSDTKTCAPRTSAAVVAAGAAGAVTGARVDRRAGCANPDSLASHFRAHRDPSLDTPDTAADIERAALGAWPAGEEWRLFLLRARGAARLIVSRCVHTTHLGRSTESSSGGGAREWPSV